MAIQKKLAEPVGITNASGEPEIVVSVGELTLSMTPPKPAAPPDPTAPAATDAENSSKER
jgi:hypothetical protein